MKYTLGSKVPLVIKYGKVNVEVFQRFLRIASTETFLLVFFLLIIIIVMEEVGKKV